MVPLRGRTSGTRAPTRRCAGGQPVRRAARRRIAAARRRIAAALALVACAGAVGCSAQDPDTTDAGVPAPLADAPDTAPPPVDPARERAEDAEPTDTSSASESTGGADRGVGSAPTGAGDDVARSTVEAVLDGYAAALTLVAADPVATTTPGHPTRAAWDAVVDPASAFSEEMLTWRVQRAAVERIVVRPPTTTDGAVSYRHHALEVGAPVLDTISFSWCGWSPGIGVDLDTGEVVDDAVAHAHGTGLVRRGADGQWRLDRLDQTDLILLAPGSDDPCPREVERHLDPAPDGQP